MSEYYVECPCCGEQVLLVCIPSVTAGGEDKHKVKKDYE